jgi:hypothetical protein
MTKKSLLYPILCLSLLISSACTRGTFLFRFADDIAASKIDHYFDLSKEQKKELKAEIKKDIDTGKKEALPKMANRLRQLEKQLDQEPVNPEIFVTAYKEIEKQVKGLTVYFQDTTMKTSVNLTQDQINHFAKEVREEIADEEKDPAEANEKVEKKYRRSLEFWVGGLSRDQDKMLKSFLAKNPYPWHLQNKSQEHVVQQFVESSKEPTARKAFVAKFVKDYESVRLPEYKTALSQHQKAFVNFLTEDFWSSMPKDQRARFKENLSARADQLDQIARQ